MSKMPVGAGMRKCIKCGMSKPIKSFALKTEAGTQRRGVCKSCEKPPGVTVSPSTRRRMCSTKVRYKTKARALGVALHAAKRAPFMRVYECPLCKGWHLTHRAAKPTTTTPEPTHQPPPEQAANESEMRG